MAHPDYPPRALTREWRVAYKRAARRLIAVFAVALCCAMVGCWLAVLWVSGHVLAEQSGATPRRTASGIRVHSVYRPAVTDYSIGSDFVLLCWSGHDHLWAPGGSNPEPAD